MWGLPYAKSNQVMGPVAVGEGCGAELSEDRGGVCGGSWGGEGGALDLGHVGHNVVGGRTHHCDTLVSVLHLLMLMKSSFQCALYSSEFMLKIGPQGRWRTG